MYTKEVLTNIEYYIIPTNKYIWIITNTNYIVYNYPTNPICTIIKNILMGKIINFNNIILEITGTDTTINNFINIMCSAFLMVFVLFICKLFIPITSTNRIMNIIIILVYSVIGAIVYFVYNHFSKLTNKVFGRDIFKILNKLFFRK